MASTKTHLKRYSYIPAPATYAWRLHNYAELHVNAESFYPSMLNAIGNAKSFVFLEMYLFESGKIADEFIRSLLDAADNNVLVYLLLDDFGCRGLKSEDKTRLLHKNIQVNYYNPLRYGYVRRNLFRDHRKILLIDSKRAFIGGAGIADEFATFTERELGWRETMIEVRGECVQDWYHAFSQIWATHSDLALPDFDINTPVLAQTLPGRVNCALGADKQGIKKSLIKRIRGAERTIWIATAYFVPSFKVRKELARAARRGVDVRLLLPGHKTDHPAVRHAGRRFYFHLLKAGAKIYEYEPRFLHQKILLCDSWVSIGSSNIDRWNFRWNLEANQEIEDQAFVDKVTTMFELDFSDSRLYQLDNWLQRPWYFRLQEWFWGKVDRLLDRIIR